MLPFLTEKRTDLLQHSPLAQQCLFNLGLPLQLLVVDFNVLEVDLLQILHCQETQVNSFTFILEQVINTAPGLVRFRQLLEEGIK